MAKSKQDKETQLLIDEAIQIAEKLKIKKILVVCESLVLWKGILPHYAKYQFIIALSGKKLAESITVETFLCDFSGVARNDRLDYILRSSVEAGKLKKGERVNLEFDLIGKYISKMMHSENNKSLTIEKLKESGW